MESVLLHVYDHGYRQCAYFELLNWDFETLNYFEFHNWEMVEPL